MFNFPLRFNLHFNLCFNLCFNRLSLYSAPWLIGASLVLPSHAIAPAAQGNQPFHEPFASEPPITEPFISETKLAQAQFTAEQLPLSALSSSSELPYGTSTRGRLGRGSIRHQGRLFSVYHFEGEAGQQIRLNLAGELASNRPPDRVQSGLWLVNPAVVLLGPNGEIVTQQPEQSNAANALIRINLPTNGTYNVFVTSTTAGSGGHYALTLQPIEPGR